MLMPLLAAATPIDRLNNNNFPSTATVFSVLFLLTVIRHYKAIYLFHTMLHLLTLMKMTLPPTAAPGIPRKHSLATQCPYFSLLLLIPTFGTGNY